MARFRLIPREHRFFEDFSAMTAELRVGARLLVEMLATDPPLVAKSDEIKEIEHRCDHITHELLKRLNSTFVTPLDREDIHALASSLDDVMDYIDAVAGSVHLYKIERIRPGAREIAAILLQCVEELDRAVGALEKRTGVMESVVEINRLENEADRKHREALARLFDEETNAVTILKWKEILDLMEECSDRCEDVGNVLESVVVKYA